MINGFETDLDRVFALQICQLFLIRNNQFCFDHGTILMKADSIVLIRDGNQKTIVPTLLWLNKLNKFINVTRLMLTVRSESIEY